MNWKTIALISAGILIALAWLGRSLLSEDDGGETEAAAYLNALELAPDDPTLARQQAEEYEHGPGGLHTIDLEELLEDYRTWAQYPPDSRPLLPGHSDVIEFHRVNLPARAMAITDASGQVIDTGAQCRIQPARHTGGEDETMHVVVYCEEAASASQSERPSLKFRSQQLTKSAADRQTVLGAERISGNDAGRAGDERAGDGIYTFAFTPTADDWGDFYFELEFEIAGRPPGEVHRLRTHFFASPRTPARFTGNFREGIRDGSLVIMAEMEVTDAGRYTIEANLFGPDAENQSEPPVGYARADARLTGGTQWVTLQFFGKVLHDRGIAGPYVLRGLRGTQDTGPIAPARLDDDPEEVERYLATVSQDRPAKRLVPYWNGGFVTRPYALAEFSRAEYAGPEKRERIETIERLIAESQ